MLKLFRKKGCEVKKIGNHTLYRGDCLKVLKEMEQGSVNLIITDPPYNVGLEYVKKYYTDNWNLPDYISWSKNWLTECKRVLTSDGSMYLINYPELNARLLSYLEDELKFKLQNWMTWHYPTNIGHSKKKYTRSQRSILFLIKDEKKYTFNREVALQPYKNPEVSKVKKLIDAGSKGRMAYDTLASKDLKELNKQNTIDNTTKTSLLDVIFLNLLKNVCKNRNQSHPCQLPHGLLQLFIEVSSNKGDVILDPFAGTFSTSLIAKKLERGSIGIEIAKKYFNIGMRRLEND